MIIATMTYPPDLEPWVSIKLRNVEEEGQICIDWVKKQLAELWNTPEIEWEGFKNVDAQHGTDIVENFANVHINDY